MSTVAVMGFGTIGSGVVEVLTKNQPSIASRACENVNIKYVLDLRDFPGSEIEDKLIKDFNIIAEDPEVDVVVETMGGIHPAYEFVKTCLEAGKSVCSSNKELVAQYGAELLAIAKEKNVNFLFEASVGGGIPIIRPLNQSLTAEKIEEITGILNGTTNYILTKMKNDGSGFDDALKEAQELGYAERNPEADVEGFDACRKIAILASLACGRQIDYKEIYTEGITGITTEDFQYAKSIGATVKLFGTCRLDGDKITAMVSPMLIKSGHPLFSVEDVFNGIYVRGNMLGDVVFYGAGAGKLPTASAVVADVIDAVKHKGKNIMTIWSEEKQELVSIDDVENRFFVRVKESNSIVNDVEKMFGMVEPLDVAIGGECAFITDKMTEKEFNDKIAEIPEFISRIRIAF